MVSMAVYTGGALSYCFVFFIRSFFYFVVAAFVSRAACFENMLGAGLRERNVFGLKFRSEYNVRAEDRMGTYEKDAEILFNYEFTWIRLRVAWSVVRSNF